MVVQKELTTPVGGSSRSQRSRRMRALPGKIGLWALIGVGAAAMFWPFVWLATSSLKTSTELFAFPPTVFPEVPLWSNFVEAFEYLGWLTVANSVLFSVAVVVGQLVLSVPSGFALAKIPIPGAKWIFLAFVGTLFIPPHVTLIPQFLVTNEFGWVNTYQGLIIPVIAQTGFGVFLFRQYFVGMPREFVDAGKIDGGTWPRIFFSIALPMAKAPIAAYTAITFLGAWNLYVWPLVVSTRPELRVLPQAVAALTNEDTIVPATIGLAATLLSTLPVAVVFLVAQRYFVGGLASSGVKG